jgi:hypothetical protein
VSPIRHSSSVMPRAGRIKRIGISGLYLYPTQPADPDVVIVRPGLSLSRNGIWQLDALLDWSA